MKKTLLILAPLSMLALAACNNSETPAADADADAAKTADASAAPVAMPPAITASGTYRCADNTILYVDFLGANEAADIRVGEKAAPATRVMAEKATADAAAAPAPAEKPATALKSADGKTMLTGSGQSISVKLADKGGQTCKSS